jgi:hypothetical protein
MPDLVMTKDGEIPDGERVMVKQTKELKDGVESTVFMLDIKGKKAVIKISGMDELSDEEVIEVIEEQLKAQGIDLKVTIADGELNLGPYPIGQLHR